MALQKMRFWRNWNFLAISQFQLSHLTCNFLHLFSRSLTLLLSLSLLFYTSFRNHQFFRLNVFPSELLWRLNLTSCNKQQLSDSCTCLCVCVWVCVNYMHFLSFYNLQVCCYSLPPSSVFHYARMFTHTAHPPPAAVLKVFPLLVVCFCCMLESNRFSLWKLDCCRTISTSFASAVTYVTIAVMLECRRCCMQQPCKLLTAYAWPMSVAVSACVCILAVCGK